MFKNYKHAKKIISLGQCLANFNGGKSIPDDVYELKVSIA